MIAKLGNLLWTFADEESALLFLYNIYYFSKDIPICCSHLCQLKSWPLNDKGIDKEKERVKTTQSNLKSSIMVYKYKCINCNGNGNTNLNLIKGFIGMYTEI